MYSCIRSCIALGLLALICRTSATQKHVHLDIAHEDLVDLLERSEAVLASFQTSAACRGCSAVTRELTTLGEMLPNSQPLQGKGIAVATIDCSRDDTAQLCSTMEVASYPTLWLFQKGIAGDESVSQSRYRGSRNAAAMLSYVVRRTIPTVNHLSSVEELEDFLEADSNVIILSGSGPDVDALSGSVVSNYADSFLFGRINGSLADMMGPSPAILCYKKPQTMRASPSTGQPRLPWSRLTGDGLKSSAANVPWLDACAQQAIHDFNRRKVHQLYALKRPIAYVFDDEDKGSAHAVHASARRWRDFVSFVQVSADQQPDLLSALELDPAGGLPALSVEGVVNADAYPMPQDWVLEKDNVDSFLQGILEGKASGGKAGQGWLERSGLVGKKKTETTKDEL